MAVRGHPLVEQAHATLGRLADAPPATEAVNAALAELADAWDRPFAAGVTGDLPALIDAVCGVTLPDRRARIRMRHGPAGYRVVRTDGTVDEQVMPDARTDAIAAARKRASAAREAVTALAVMVPRRPAWWQFWRWPRYWREVRRVGPHAPARAEAAALATAAEALEAAERLARERYLEDLREAARGEELTLTAPMLTVELVEITGALTIAAARHGGALNIDDTRQGGALNIADARPGGALNIDALLLSRDGQLFAPTRGGHPLAAGTFTDVIAALPDLLAEARALRIAKRIEVKIKGVMTSLADAIERKEATFRERLAKLGALRLADPARFAAGQLARVRGEISASVTAVVEHASVHLGAELAALQTAWIGEIAAARDADALARAVANIEEDGLSRPHRIAEETRGLVTGGLAGCARDIYPRVVEALAQYGLPAQALRVREAPAMPAVSLLPSLTTAAGKLEKPGRLAGLFKSFEGKRANVREKVHERVERMRELAAAELLDAEPRMTQAIASALADMLDTAIAAHQAWLDAALDTERAAIERERETLTPLRSVHDAVRTETYRLSELIAQLERREPVIAVAAAAAETVSPSH